MVRAVEVSIKYCSSILLRALDTRWACLVAGLLAPLSFAPFNQGWLVFLLLLPLLQATRHPDPAERVLRGALFGLSYFGLGCYWLSHTLVVEVGYAWPVAIAANLLIAAALALAPTIFCWLGGYIRRTPGLLWIAWPALWYITADIRFQVLGGGPWLSLALSQIDSPLSGYVALVGEAGTSALVILVSYWLLQLVSFGARSGNNPADNRSFVTRQSIKTGLYAGAIVTVFSVGAVLNHQLWTHATGVPIRVALVQSATRQRAKLNPQRQLSRLEKLRDLSEPLYGRVDLVIWPETVVVWAQQQVSTVLAQSAERARRAKTTLLLGAFEKRVDGHRFNTMFTLGLESGQRYRKHHLVPFGEMIPPFFSWIEKFVPGDRYRAMGGEPQLLVIRGQLIGVSICWEGQFSRDLLMLARRGASVLFNSANEAWFAGTSLPQQNLNAMRLRALENGRPAVRVANLGPSAIIDFHGKVVQQLAAAQAGFIVGTVQPRVGRTPFMDIGPDFLLLLTFAIFVVTGIRNLLIYTGRIKAS